MIELILPLPNMALSPNRKNGCRWQATKNIKNADISVGYFAALEQAPRFNCSFNKEDKLFAELIFYRSNSKADLDNLLSSFKAMGDGICTALKINDNQIIKILLSKECDKKNPRLVFKLSHLQ